MQIKKIISSVISLLSVAFVLCGCSSSSNDDSKIYLHIYNWEDYIYQNDPGEGYEEDDMIQQFTSFANSVEGKKLYGLNKDVEVIYDTFDTPETMYNQLKLNKTSYDLMCPSDYMIQKLALNLDGLASTRIQKIDFSKMPNYTKYVSPFLKDNLEAVKIDEKDSSKGTLADYAVGYMWGTLGLLYNPGAKTLANKGYSEEQIINDFNAPDAWNILWNNKDYASVASIKDSIRDTYAMGIMHVYNDEFENLNKQHKAGTITTEVYKKSINEIFNRSDDKTIQKVQDALIELKNRIYGFEVDTGKTDIVTGKVGINLAWSGDAVYSMDQAEEYNQFFYYALPQYGANIWFDGWIIPETCKGDNLSAAYAFLDFMSNPAKAALNMDYIGYTPFIGGDEVLSQVHEWYDSEETNTYSYDLSYFFKGTLNNEELEMTINCDEAQRIRQLHAQYPESSEIDHLCIMKDFGQANDEIVTMWENVKVNPLPIWVSIVVVFGIVGMLAYLGSYQLIRKAKLKHRKQLRKKD